MNVSVKEQDLEERWLSDVALSLQRFIKETQDAGTSTPAILWCMGAGWSEANALINGRSQDVSARVKNQAFDLLFSDELPTFSPIGDRVVRCTFGEDHRQAEWPQPGSMTWSDLCAKLTHGREGEKLGSCIVPATLRGDRRRKEAAAEIDVLFLDSDAGHSLDEIEGALMRAGFTACIASTHSHLTTRTAIKTSNWKNFLDQHPSGTPEQYLLECKGFRPAIAAGASVEESDISYVSFLHPPCPKFRIAILLEEPWRAADFDTQVAANAAWADWVRAVAAVLRIQIDLSCVDPSRLFFLPRFPVGGKCISRILHGRACDPRSLIKANVPTEMTKSLPTVASSYSLLKWGARYGRRFKIVEALRSRSADVFVDHVADDKRHHIECPFADEHTSEYRDRATFICNPGSGATDGFAIHCRHAHCAGRDRLDFVGKMIEDGWLEEADLTADQFLVPAADAILELIEEMNAQFAVVVVSGKTMILKEEQRADGSLDVVFTRPSEVQSWFANRQITLPSSTGATVRKNTFDIWFKHPDRRQYERVELAPEGASPGAYNLWRGFAITPNRSGSCELFLAHLRDVVCSGSEQHFQWLLAFFAQLFQMPGDKPGVAVVLRGGQGTGKSIVGKYVGGMMPAHYVEVSRTEHLTGRFTAHLSRAALIQAEEAFWAGDKNAEGSLKALVTSDVAMIEPKGVDAFLVRSIARLLITSNNSWVVPAGPDERRFAVFDVSSRKQQDTIYFAAMDREMRNGGRAALLAFLLKFDLRSVNLRQIPRTEGLLDQKLASLASFAQWWLGCLREGSIGTFGWSTEIPKAELYCLYGEYVRHQRGYRTNEAVFFQEMRPLLPEVIEKRPAGNGGRQRLWIIPEIDKCRNHFSKWIGQTINWDR